MMRPVYQRTGPAFALSSWIYFGSDSGLLPRNSTILGCGESLAGLRHAPNGLPIDAKLLADFSLHQVELQPALKDAPRVSCVRTGLSACISNGGGQRKAVMFRFAAKRSNPMKLTTFGRRP